VKARSARFPLLAGAPLGLQVLALSKASGLGFQKLHDKISNSVILSMHVFFDAPLQPVISSLQELPMTLLTG
jgi:hypothetical protein